MFWRCWSRSCGRKSCWSDAEILLLHSDPPLSDLKLSSCKPTRTWTRSGSLASALRCCFPICRHIIIKTWFMLQVVTFDLWLPAALNPAADLRVQNLICLTLSVSCPPGSSWHRRSARKSLWEFKALLLMRLTETSMWRNSLYLYY